MLNFFTISKLAATVLLIFLTDGQSFVQEKLIEKLSGFFEKSP